MEEIEYTFECKHSECSPLLMMLPHSGRDYKDILNKQSHLPLSTLRKSEDTYLDLLFKTNTLNFNYIKANFPRILVDVNRSPLEIDAKMWKKKHAFTAHLKNSTKVDAGIGVFPKVSFSGQKLYKNRLLFSEARRRFLRYYFPYHKKVRSFLNNIRKKHSFVIAIDCHSMSSEIVENNIDIVLSDNNGKAADKKYIKGLKEIFNKYNYNVSINMPFKGGFTTKYYGKPDENVHAIQIEINKKVYLIESDFMIIKNKLKKLKNCFFDIINYINQNHVDKN